MRSSSKRATSPARTSAKGGGKRDTQGPGAASTAVCGEGRAEAKRLLAERWTDLMRLASRARLLGRALAGTRGF